MKFIATLAILSIASISSFSAAYAAGTAAGTDIQNRASATYNTLSGPITVDSNQVTVRVDELLDVIVNNVDPGPVSTSPNQTNNVQTFSVTNNGNGDEAFILSANPNLTGDDFDPNLVQIIIDNGNDLYEPGLDTVYISGTNDPVIPQNSSLTIFVITDTPGNVGDGDRGEVALSATAVTASGTPGTIVIGGGDGGSDAVVSINGAQGEDSGFLIISSISVNFTKSATIMDPAGGTMPYAGAIITYTLGANTIGTGTISNFVITDQIPQGTVYVPGSIMSNGVSQTDVVDGDAGNFNGTSISVSLGNVGANENHVVTFQVVIQ